MNENNFKFVPVIGSDKAIGESEKVKGKMYFSTNGKVYFDKSDEERIILVKSDANYIHEQGVSSRSWKINHICTYYIFSKYF